MKNSARTARKRRKNKRPAIAVATPHGQTQNANAGAADASEGARAAPTPEAPMSQQQRAVTAQPMRAGRVRLIDVQIPKELSDEERVWALFTGSLEQCLPCDAKCRVFAVGIHRDRGGNLFYPMCHECFEDLCDPIQERAFKEAIRQRFIKLGEVQP